MELSKGFSKQGRKKSNRPCKANQCKVKIVYKPSPSNPVRLLNALSMLLNQEDILDYFVPQKKSQRKAKKPPKKKGNQDLHHLECMSRPSPIDKYPSKALGLNNEGAK